MHFLRNALDYLSRKQTDDCLTELRWLYDRHTAKEARCDLTNGSPLAGQAPQTLRLGRGQWDQIFKDPMTTMAAIDRLVHHATILEFNGESHRAQSAIAKTRA